MTRSANFGRWEDWADQQHVVTSQLQEMVKIENHTLILNFDSGGGGGGGGVSENCPVSSYNFVLIRGVPLLQYGILVPTFGVNRQHWLVCLVCGQRAVPSVESW